MYLNQTLLDSCEDFFELITNEDNDEKLDHAINSLRSFLEKNVDGFTSFSDEKLAFVVQSRLNEVWRLISDQEKTNNPELKEMYDEILSLTEDVCGYESDGDDL